MPREFYAFQGAHKVNINKMPAEIRVEIYKLTLTDVSNIFLKAEQTQPFNNQRLIAPSALIGVSRAVNREYYATLLEHLFSTRRATVTAKLEVCDFRRVLAFLRDPMGVTHGLTAIMFQGYNLATLRVVCIDGHMVPFDYSFRRIHAFVKDAEELGVSVAFVSERGHSARVVITDPDVPWARVGLPLTSMVRAVGGRIDPDELEGLRTWLRAERRRRLTELGLTFVDTERKAEDIVFQLGRWNWL